MYFQSKLQKAILDFIPYFKGCWFIYTNFLKVLPYKWRMSQLGEDIIVDLTDPPQFSIVKMRKGIIEPTATDFIKSHLKEGDVFIDVGSNWGYFTVLASKVVGEKGLVVSIEPLRNTFKKLLDTISRNHVFCVFPLNAAVGEKFELTDFIKPWFRQSTSAYMMKKNGDEGTTLTVTIDWITENIQLSDRNLKIVKIDVEGAELLVLKGAVKTLNKYKPFVIIEIGEECVRFGYDLYETYEFMRSLGYKPLYNFALLDNGKEGKIVDCLQPKTGQIVFGT